MALGEVGKFLSYFVSNLSKTLHINFYQNPSSIVEVIIKKFGAFFMPHSVHTGQQYYSQINHPTTKALHQASVGDYRANQMRTQLDGRIMPSSHSITQWKIRTAAINQQHTLPESKTHTTIQHIAKKTNEM